MIGYAPDSDKEAFVLTRAQLSDLYYLAQRGAASISSHSRMPALVKVLLDSKNALNPPAID